MICKIAEPTMYIDGMPHHAFWSDVCSIRINITTHISGNKKIEFWNGEKYYSVIENIKLNPGDSLTLRIELI